MSRIRKNYLFGGENEFGAGPTPSFRETDFGSFLKVALIRQSGVLEKRHLLFGTDNLILAGRAPLPRRIPLTRHHSPVQDDPSGFQALLSLFSG